MKYDVHFEDGHVETVTEDNGTAAKIAARRIRNVRKEACKITRVRPLPGDRDNLHAHREGGQ